MNVTKKGGGKFKKWRQKVDGKSINLLVYNHILKNDGL
jgi:hypothetical protein